MGEAMQHAGTSHAAGRPSSSATGSGSRAITEVKYQILWFQLHTIPKKKYSTLCHCVFPNSRLLFLSWGAAPAPVHPAPIADPARDREASLIVPARVGSSEESSPGQGCDTEEKPKKKDTRKKDKKDKKKKTKDDDDNEENQEHVPLPGGKNDDDEDDFNDLDGMNDLLDLGEDEKASQKKDTTKKKPATSKNVPMKRPAKKHDEAG